MAKTIDFEQALYDRFGQVNDFTLGMRIASYFFKKGMDYALDELSSLCNDNEPSDLIIDRLLLTIADLKK